MKTEKEHKAYEEGFYDGNAKAYSDLDIDNLDPLMTEQIGVNFAVEKFKDCKTLEDFQTEYA